MRARQLFRIICIAGGMLMLPLVARAAVWSGDTVSIKYMAGTETRYLCAEHSQVTSTQQPATDAALWQLVSVNDKGVRCRNVATGDWLRVTQDGMHAVLSLTDSLWSSVIRLTVVEDTYTDNRAMTVHIGIRTDGADGYLTANDKGLWVLQDKPSNVMQIEQWTRRHRITTTLNVASENMVFPWAANDTEAQAQAVALRYWVRLVDSTYNYCLANGHRQTPTVRVVTDGTIVKSRYGISPEVQWLSAQKTMTNSSVLPASWIDNAGQTAEHSEVSRAMMQYAQPVADAYGWKVMLTPQGRSPLNIKQQGNYVDYVDTLSMRLVQGSNEMGKVQTEVVRSAYHYANGNRLIADIRVDNYAFGAQDNLTKQLTPAFTLLTGEQLYDVNRTLVGGNPQTSTLTLADLARPTVQVLNEQGKAVDWLQVQVDENNNAITATATPNTQAQVRSAQIVLSDGADSVTAVPVTQAARASTVVAKLIHQPGVGNKMMGISVAEDEMQPVYTAEKTIYYHPGEWIHLVSQTTSFYGYQRWYDYETGKDPIFPRIEGNTEDATTWADAPRGSFKTLNQDSEKKYFRAINTDYEHSQGLYAVAGDVLPNPDKYGLYAPQLVGWNSDTVRRTVACDFSMYKDFYVQRDGSGNLVSVKEPTLSYRQLFHLRPAEDMAKQLAECTESNGKYLEEYHYIAPTGTPIYLNTQYAHCYFTDFETEYGYYFRDKENYLWRVSFDSQSNFRPFAHVQWYQDDKEMTPQYVKPTSNGVDGQMGYKGYLDYVAVSSNTPGKVVYTIRIPKVQSAVYYKPNSTDKIDKGMQQVLDEDLLLARFVVEYKDISECGPAKALSSDTDFDDYYDLLTLQDFNYDRPGTDKVTFYPKPRAWDKSSYAFTYTDHNNPPYARNYPQKMDGHPFPSFNEFSIVNKVVPEGNLNWVYETEQRGGAENGYCIYVDGSKLAGMVATVDIDTVLCAQQKVYCSLWVCDLTPKSQSNGAKPVIVCRVQGSKTTGADTDWHDVEVFNSGELPHDQAGWKHIFFPVESDVNYDKVRLQIYNFATGISGNDFLIDDVALYATKNPLAAYQALTSCSNDDRDVAVIRIDYTNLPDSWAHTEVFYQVCNTTDKKAVITNYLHYPQSEYGKIFIPCQDYDPTDGPKAGHPITADESKMVYPSLNAFVDSLYTYTLRDTVLKGYVRHEEEDHYTMYVGHVFTNSTDVNGTLNRSKDYEIRMARSVDDLSDDLCSYRTPLPIYDQTGVVVTDVDDNEQSGLVCANALYKLKTMVSKSITQGTQVVKISAPATADWLVAFDFDDDYQATSSTPDKIDADVQFKQKYGYTRDEVTDAIHDMRRLPEPEQPNPNYSITHIKDLRRSAFDRPANYDIIVSLYRKGLLRFSEKEYSVYLMSDETTRYWIFPIKGEITTIYQGKDIDLEVCDQPLFFAVTAQTSDQMFTLGPVKHGDLTPEQRGKVQNVRVTEKDANRSFSVPVSDSKEATIVEDNCQILLSNDPNMAGKTVKYHPQLTDNAITFTPESSNPCSMQAGYEYTIRLGIQGIMTFAEEDETPISVSQCEGNAYFTVLVLPDTVLWTPTISNEWGEDSNWRAIIGGKKQLWGYAPLRNMVAIVQEQEDDDLYPVITTNNRNPLDANYTSQACSAMRLQKGAKLQNQHLLTYDSIFIDMPMKSARWYSMSAPLQGMVSGDFFIPYDAEGNNVEYDHDFRVHSFQGNRKGSGTYAFWLSYYNRSVPMLNENPDNNYDSISTNIEVFAKSNSLAEPLLPGQGFQALGYGPGEDGEDLVIRLPKPDKVYYYYNPDGTQSTRCEQISRTNAGRLAYPETVGEGTMTITLSNGKESRHFLFGNPTMAYIDMAAFFADNAEVDNSFRYMDGSSWKAVTPATTSTEAEQFVAPMQSVLLTAKNATTSLTLTLKDSHLATSSSVTLSASQSVPQRVQRIASVPQADDNEVMNITAYNANAAAFAALAIQHDASNDYVFGEDVPFILSGVGNGYTNASTATTPLNIYTLAGTHALMADIRKGISVVPLGFVISDEDDGYGSPLYRTDSLTLSFRLTPNWGDNCYLCDTRTGARTLIGNDTEIRIATPADHELRYYIQGSYQVPDTPDTPTNTEDVPATANTRSSSLFAISNAQGTATVIATEGIASIRAYDLVGRTLLYRHKEGSHTLGAVITLQLPSGVALIEATLSSGQKAQTKVIVR